MEHTSYQELVTALEDLLVKEFRTLQTLVVLTKEERATLVEGKADQVLRVVEEKEVVLDQMGLLEDSRRMLIDQLGAHFGLSQPCTVSRILSMLEIDVQQRLTNLNNGIMTLVDQARDLNDWNRAYAAGTIEWLDAAQAFLLRFLEPNRGYQRRGMGSYSELPVTLEVSRMA